jgi:hypothetical protein
MNLSVTTLADLIVAIGALGTAAFALVDTSKAFFGGVSNVGFSNIRKMLDKVYGGTDHRSNDRKTASSYGSVRGVLRANWINGAMSFGDQKAIAKTLLKLRLDTNTAPHLASLTGVDETLLKSVATKYTSGGALVPDEQNVAARFDLQLSTLIDEGYQFADQRYRNWSKLAAVPVAVGLAYLGRYALNDPSIPELGALICGLLAAPLAPVSKDLASALQASVKALQFLKR